MCAYLTFMYCTAIMFSNTYNISTEKYFKIISYVINENITRTEDFPLVVGFMWRIQTSMYNTLLFGLKQQCQLKPRGSHKHAELLIMARGGRGEGGVMACGTVGKHELSTNPTKTFLRFLEC